MTSHLRNIDVSRFVLAALITFPLFAHGVTRYEGGQWFNGTTFERRDWYSVEGQLREKYDAEPDAVVKLDGRFVIPPLAEAHTHDFSTEDDLEADVERYLRGGVFYVRNVNGATRSAAAVRTKVNQPETIDLLLANGGITAPGGHPVQIYARIAAQHPGFVPEDNTYFTVASNEELERKWPAILAAKPDLIKAYLESSEEFEERKDDARYVGERALSPEMLRRVVEKAHAAKLRVTVHVTTAPDFRTAVNAGADEIAHLPLEKLTDEDARAAARRGVVVVTTTTSHRPAGGIDADSVHAHNLRILREAGVPLAIGTDSGRTVVDELMNVGRLLPLPRAELLKLAVEVTPRAMFPGRRIGRLSEGFEASFLALEGDPLEDLANLRRISMRVKQGHAIEVEALKPSIVEALMPVAMQKGAMAALDLYVQLRADPSFSYDDSEAAFNRLGYALLAHDRIPDAIIVFTFNTERFPVSWNVWDSLAEAFLKSGDRERALQHYRKSLELNPHNENARKLIEEVKKE